MPTLTRRVTRRHVVACHNVIAVSGDPSLDALAAAEAEHRASSLSKLSDDEVREP
jgi:hypothetical protein